MEEEEAEFRFRSRLERAEIVSRYDAGREKQIREIDDWEDPKLELYHTRDRYGFIHDKRLPEIHARNEREQRQIKTEVARSIKWAEMIKDEQKYFR